MVKRAKILFLFFGILFLCKTLNVDASTSLPASYSQNGYDYKIEALKVACYRGTVALREEEKAKEDDISKSVEDVTINPQLKVGRITSSRGPYIGALSLKLNLSLTPNFNEYVKNYMNDLIGTDNYTCVLKAEYKIKKKENYNYFYQADTLLFQVENPKFFTKVVDQEGYFSASQVVDVAVVNKDKSITDNCLGLHGPEIGKVTYSILSKRELDDKTELNNENELLLYVHNMDNFDIWVEDNNNNNSISDNNNSNTTSVTPIKKQKQKVKVPDTDASMRLYLMIGISILLVGSSIVLFELRKLNG